MNIEYNTQRDSIIFKEYGRNMQKLVNHIHMEADKEKRNQQINTLVGLSKKITSPSESSSDNTQQIWNDLYAMTNFELDVDCPYPIQKEKKIKKTVPKLEYPPKKSPLRYGRNINNLLKNILHKKNPEELKNATIYLGRLLNTFHSNWNAVALSNAAILKNIEQMSNSNLTLDLDEIDNNNLFEKLYHEKRSSQKNWKNTRREKKPYGKRHGKMQRR